MHAPPHAQRYPKPQTEISNPKIVKIMAKDNLVLVSCRIDPETLEKIEKQVKKHYYWKRNTIINGILTAVMDNFTDQQVYDMIRYWRKGQNEVKANFEIVKREI